MYLVSGYPFVVYNDHRSLQTAIKKKYIHGRLARWMDLMPDHELEIKYDPGREKVAVYFLSRRNTEKLDGRNDENVTEGFVATVYWTEAKMDGLEPQLPNLGLFIAGERGRDHTRRKRFRSNGAPRFHALERNPVPSPERGTPGRASDQSTRGYSGHL